MYQNIYFDKFQNEIHIWDDKTGYDRVKFKNYAYLLNDTGDYTTIDGARCNKVYSWSETAVKTKMVCEHDVPETTRYLIDRYGDSDAVSDNVITMFFDIEVAKEGKYSTPEDANNTITSIAYYTELHGYHTLLLDKHNPPRTYTSIIKPDKKELSIEVKTFNDEKSLLFAFLKEYRNISPHILTGWNIDYYDIPYLYNRMINVLDVQYANQLSPINKVGVKKYDNNNIIQIAGVTALDYLMLYKKFTYSEQSNYRLNTISNIELKRSKIEYTGDLDYLYSTDINKFIEYNVVDVDLVLELDRKLDLINIARGICHKGHVSYDDIVFTSKYLDGAALTYCRRNNLIATSTRTSGESTTAEGAYVKDPTPGLYKWVYDLDLTSLYPMNIISLNISPETKFAKILNWDEEDYVNSPDKLYNIKLFRDDTVLGNFSNEFGVKSDSVRISGIQALLEFVKKHNLSIASNGVMYTLDKIGLIPAILDTWFADRDDFKNLRKQYETSGDLVLAAYYDKQQLITKIMLNSFYGVLLLESFRFYDKDNGEAVTITGKSVIKWGSKMANYFYNKKLGNEHAIDYTIYIDTDSVAGDSNIIVNGDTPRTLDDVFADSIKNSYFVDSNHREFTFPSIKLPYYDESTKSVKLGDVEYIERHYIKKRRYKITLKSGKHIVVTEDHSVMVELDNGELVQKLTKDLNVSDKVISI